MVERIDNPEKFLKEIPAIHTFTALINKPHRSRTKTEIEDCIRSSREWIRFSEETINQLIKDVNALVSKRERDSEYIRSLEKQNNNLKLELAKLQNKSNSNFVMRIIKRFFQ